MTSFNIETWNKVKGFCGDFFSPPDNFANFDRRLSLLKATTCVISRQLKGWVILYIIIIGIDIIAKRLIITHFVLQMGMIENEN